MAEILTINSLSAAHRKQVQALKRPITDLAQKFGIIREKLADLAPKVIKLFTAILAEHEGFTFVEFCRLFDATIPTHAADRDGVTGYRNHRVYNTLAYMRRLVQTNRQGRRGQQGVRDSATDGMARLIATLREVVENDAPIWDAIQSEFGFSERLMTRLRKRVENTKPLIALNVTKPAKIGKVIHMERLTAPTPEPLPATGRRVTIEGEGASKRRAA